MINKIMKKALKDDEKESWKKDTFIQFQFGVKRGGRWYWKQETMKNKDYPMLSGITEEEAHKCKCDRIYKKTIIRERIK